MLDNSSNKKNPFKVPENYFQDFNTKIMEQIAKEENTKAKKIIPLWKKVLPLAVAIAACVAVIFNVTSISDANSLQVEQKNSYTNNITVSEDEMFDIMEDQLIAASYQDVLFEEIYSK